MSSTGRLLAIATALLTLTLGPHARAQHAANESVWPAPLPALGARVADPGDDLGWVLSTRIDAAAVVVTANTPSGSLAVSLRRIRQGHATCPMLFAQLFHTDAYEAMRAPNPRVFRGAPWDSAAYQQTAHEHDAEFGCLAIGTDVWLGTALAESHAGGTLAQTTSIALQLARALEASTTRRDYPVVLDASGIELDDPGDASGWLFLGPTHALPVASDAISSGAAESGGVTLTVSRRNGTCGDLWLQVRPAFRVEGTLVDRPGYVPAAFGSRVRRIPSDDRTREVYCAATAHGAVLVTSVFRTDDGNAMTRMAPLLRALVGGT